MYAHEAIKSIEKFIKKSGNAEATIWMKNLITQIKNSQMFHFGEASTLDDMFNIKKRKDPSYGFGIDTFIDPLDSELRMPYPLCWFDYSTEARPPDNEMNDKYNSLDLATKKAFLISEIIPGKLLGCISFGLGENDHSQWMFSLVVYYISLGTDLSTNWAENSFAIVNDKIFKPWVYRHKPKKIQDVYSLFNGFEGIDNIYPCFIFDPEKSATEKESINAATDMISIKLIELSLRLINCKNIVPERVHRTYRMRVGKKMKTLQSKNKFKYHVLNVIKPGIKKPSDTTVFNIGNSTRVHLCRGHYRHYIDKGLFGKYFGRFWIQDHVRGDKKKGILIKDYNIHGNLT